MADVRVTLPEVLGSPKRFHARLETSVRVGMRVAMVETVEDIKKYGDVPRNTGLLTRSLKAVDVTVADGAVRSGIKATGAAAVYADVMDKGRRRGKKVWFGWLLYGRGQESNREKSWRTGWIFRKRRDDVDALARRLQAEYKAAHPKKRKGVSRAIGKFQRRAAFLLARKVALNIFRRGIRGYEYARQYAPGGDRHDELVARITARISEQMRRRGLVT